MMELKKIFDKSSDALYDAKESAEILKAFNDIIHGLYKIYDHQWIVDRLNITTYTEEEYRKILGSIGLDIADIAGRFEMARNLIFGDCFNWDSICDELENLKKEE